MAISPPSERIWWQYREVAPHANQDTEIMLLAGGPSLADFEDEIRERREAGTPLVTTNGAYNWCLERNLTPSIQIMVDGREFNRRFVEPTVPKCWYLIASQCHPSVAAMLPRDQVLLWHSGAHLKGHRGIRRPGGELPRVVAGVRWVNGDAAGIAAAAHAGH